MANTRIHVVPEIFACAACQNYPESTSHSFKLVLDGEVVDSGSHSSAGMTKVLMGNPLEVCHSGAISLRSFEMEPGIYQPLIQMSIR